MNHKSISDYLLPKVEQHLEYTIRVFQNMREEELVRPALNGGWSIAQCLWHLNSYGDFYFPHIRQVLAKAGEGSGFKSGWLGAYLTRMMDPEKGKAKYPAFKSHKPDRHLNGHVVVATFIEQQELLLDLLKKASGKDLHQRIPLSVTNLIRLKTGDVLQFIVAHNERHLRQAKRVVDQIAEATSI